jgi:CheY-like chemotaxis protein
VHPGEAILNVLLVDDDISMLRIFEELLKEEGHRVTTALSGEDALPLLAKHGPPDLLLVDSSMPRMSGSEFLTKVKAAHPEVYEQTRIVGFTAFQKGASVIRDFETQVHELVEKPRDIDEFLEFIRGLSSAKS